MTDKEHRLFAAELNLLAAATRGLVTEPLLGVFWEEFRNEALVDWRAACVKARRALDFFPSVHEMRSFLPSKPRPIDPLLKRLLEPYERKEPWPDQPLIGTPEFPRPHAAERPESELERGAAQRMREMHAGAKP